ATQFDNDTVTPLLDQVGTTDGVVDIPFVVSGVSAPVAKVSASFYATHTFDSDLVISLIAPDNTAVNLIINRGGSADNFGTACSPASSRTTLDDGAAAAIESGSAPFAGTFRPDEPLSTFNGKAGPAVNGTWKLRFRDTASEDTGTFFCGSIVIATATCVV